MLAAKELQMLPNIVVCDCLTLDVQYYFLLSEHEQVEAVNVRMNLAAVDEPIVQPLNYDIFSG